MKIFIVCLALTNCAALQIPIRECTYKGHSASGKISSIDIEPLAPGDCDVERRGAKVCQFRSDTSYNGTIKFHTDVGITSATTEVFAILNGVKEPFVVNPPNACLKGIPCPITKGSEVTYHAEVHVPDNKAGISGVATWRLIGENDGAHLCFLMPFIIY